MRQTRQRPSHNRSSSEIELETTPYEHPFIEELENIIEPQSFTFINNEIKYSSNNLDYTNILLKLFDIDKTCSFEPDASCDCKDILEYSNMFYILYNINSYVLNKKDPIIQNVLFTDQKDVFDYMSLESFKTENFESKYILEKEFEMIDLQNYQNLNMLANTYLYFLNQSNYLLPFSKNEVLSFLNNIIHFFDNTLILSDLPIIENITDDIILPVQFSIYIMKQMHLAGFISFTNHCLPENKFFVDKTLPISYEMETPIVNLSPERQFNIISEIKIVCKKDLLLLQKYFQNYPDIEKKYKVFPILPHTKYILLYQDMIQNKTKSLELKSNSVEINYLIVNLQNFRIFKFDKLSYFNKEIIFAMILFTLIIIFLFRR